MIKAIQRAKTLNINQRAKSKDSKLIRALEEEYSKLHKEYQALKIQNKLK